jgi:hypothetical protein
MDSQIPADAQADLLLIIKGWRDSLKELANSGKLGLLPASGKFSYVVTVDEMNENDLNDQAKALKQYLPNLPYSKNSLKECLDRILDLVPQIKATCVLPWGLAKALDLLLFDVSETPQMRLLLNEANEPSVSYLSQRFFEEPFTRMGLIHLYNLKTDRSEVKLPDINARILTLTESDVPLITGESTFISKLHYGHTGNCFLVFENNEIADNEDWLSEKWDVAWGFISLLKYLKNNVIDIDYAGLWYKPVWANGIKRYGIDIMGRPRWHEQNAPYHLSEEMLPKLLQYMEAAKALTPIFSDFSSDLRRTLRLAGLRYEIHHTKHSEVEQLLDLTIALEALFSPSDRTELRFKISQAAALLIGENGTEKKEIFDFIKRMYDERSGFVHGGKDPVETGKVTNSDIQRLGDLVRRAILRFATIFARGGRSRDAIHQEILLAAFDSTKGEDLRNRSDVDLFLDEKFKSAGS